MKKSNYILLVLLLLNFSAISQVVDMQMRDTSGKVNSFIDIPIRVTGSLTGRGIVAYRLQFTFNDRLITPVGVVTTGTLSNTLGAPTVNLNVRGQITIAAAGTTALSGTGIFIYLRFNIIESGGTGINSTGKENNYFNEGQPELTISRNCFLNCIGLPLINISPNTAVLLKGQTQNFSASNGTAPYTWSSNNNSVATINSTGTLTANEIGFTSVKVTDATSNTNQSGIIEVRGYQLSIPDTTGGYNTYMNIPVRVTNLTGLNIVSGSFQFNYNPSCFTDISIVTEGTLLSVTNPVLNINSANNLILVSFAHSSVINGAGILFYLRGKLSNAQGCFTGLNFNAAVLNESLAAITKNGSINYSAPPSISLSYANNYLVYSDSMQINVTRGTPPYLWSLSDDNLATITPGGLLKVKRSGLLKITVTDSKSAVTTSNDIQLYDTYLKIGDSAVAIGSSVDVPVTIKDLPDGQSVFSVQGRIYTDNPSLFTLTDIITNGAGFSGAAMSTDKQSGYIQFAIASSTPIPGNSVLFYIRGTKSSTAQRGSSSNLYFQNLLLNEGIPLPYLLNGNITARMVYIFTGNGNWSDANNWQFKLVPPASFSGTDEIIIDPIANGECLLNVSQSLLSKTKLTVKSGKKFRIPSNLSIIK